MQVYMQDFLSFCCIREKECTHYNCKELSTTTSSAVGLREWLHIGGGGMNGGRDLYRKRISFSLPSLSLSLFGKLLFRMFDPLKNGAKSRLTGISPSAVLQLIKPCSVNPGGGGDQGERRGDKECR